MNDSYLRLVDFWQMISWERVKQIAYFACFFEQSLVGK
jgi:hypothetical protein